MKMSSLTSSTEIDGASSVPRVESGTNNATNEASPELQTANTQSHASLLTLEGNNDSLTDEYVHVDNVPGTESDEIRNISNQQSIIAGYLDYIPSLTSILPEWLYPVAVNDSSTSSITETNESNKNFETWLKETNRGAYTGSIEEEQQFRACLIRAISDNFDALQGIAQGFLLENSSVTQEELCYARSSESQYSRRLLLMLLQRDTRAMLRFLFRLLDLAKDIVGRIVLSLHQNLESGIAYKVQCLRCILEERVSICVISDHLPKCDSGLLTFVNIVSEEDQPAKPSVSKRLWNNLFETVKDNALYGKVIRMITSAIESCGYHTDIVRMLNEEMEMARNSFICKCGDMRDGKTCATIGSQENLEPSMSRGADGERSAAGQSVPVEVQYTQRNENGIVGTDTTHVSASNYKYENIGNEIVANNGSQNSGAFGCAEAIKRARGNVDNEQTALKHPQREHEKSEISGNEELKRKPPELGSDKNTTRHNTSRRMKRKEVSSGNESKEKRRRNDDEGKSRSSSFGNCDLQMEMLKIAIPGQDNQPDSGLSLRSTSSYGDSGICEPLTMCSVGENDDETVPKQIAFDLNLSVLHSGKDKRAETALGETAEDTHRDEAKADLSGLTDQESDLNKGSIEDQSYEHDESVDIDNQDGMLTLTASENEKVKKYETI